MSSDTLGPLTAQRPANFVSVLGHQTRVVISSLDGWITGDILVFPWYIPDMA